MKVSYEAKEGVTQVTLFVPGALLVVLGVAALQVALMVVEGYHSAPWLHGATVDVDTLLFRSDALRIAPPDGAEPDLDAIRAILAELLTPRVVFLTTWLQNLALVGLCALLGAGAAWVRQRLQGSGATVGQALRDTFALRGCDGPEVSPQSPWCCLHWVAPPGCEVADHRACAGGLQS